jgi:hypothetical protein
MARNKLKGLIVLAGIKPFRKFCVIYEYSSNEMLL